MAISTTTVTDHITGERTTTIRGESQVIRVSERVGSLPLTVIVPSSPRQRCEILSTPWNLDFDHAVAYWSLHLLGQRTSLDAINQWIAA
jgi:hypothetical protein